MKLKIGLIGSSLALAVMIVLAACQPLGLPGETPLPTQVPPIIVRTATDVPSTPVPSATPQPPTATPVPATGSINGSVWHDLCEPGKDGQPQPVNPPAGCVRAADGSYHANGVLDAGEPSIPGVKVRLGLGACPAAGLAEAIVGANGAYTFTGLAAGTYCVSVDANLEPNFSILLPGNWSAPAYNNNAQTVTLNENEGKAGVNFGWDYQLLPNLPCVYRATFIADVTVPDNSRIAANTAFTKTWRVQNDGNCAWGPGFAVQAIAFVNGTQLSGQPTANLTQVVPAGGVIDISVPMVAPAQPGTYLSEWKLAIAGSGQLFGVGQNSAPLYAQIVVPAPTAVPATPTRTATPVTFVNWRGEYFNNRNLSGNPTALRDDANLDFNWAVGAPLPNLPADNFSVRWTRTLPFNMGTYRFRVLADDGVRVWLDNQLIIDDWRDGGAGEVSAEVALTQGNHSLRVEYYENAGDAAFKLWWEAVGSPTFPDWKGEYWNNRNFTGAPVLVRNDRAVDFDWGTNAPAAGLPGDDFSVRWSRWVTFEPGIYRFSVNADDGVRLYVDGQLILDEWREQDGTRTFTVDRALNGPRAVTVEYFDRAGRGLIKMRWERLANTPTPTLTPSVTPTPSATPTTPPTVTPTITPTPTQPVGSVSGRLWQDECAATGQEAVAPDAAPAGCVIGPDNRYRANGVAEQNEQGIGSVKVVLVEGACGTVSIDPRALETLTDGSGNFTFINLKAGTYCLAVNPALAGNLPILADGYWTKPVLEALNAELSINVQLAAGENKTGATLGWDYVAAP